MSNWITQADYKPNITDNRLMQIIEDDTDLLDTVEATAVQVVRDHLYAKYDVDNIFSTSGSDRHAQVLRWCVNLAIYYLYERVPDAMVPERVSDNYVRTLEALLDISDGKRSVELPHNQDSDDYPTTKFRWGSETPREHR